MIWSTEQAHNQPAIGNKSRPPVLLGHLFGLQTFVVNSFAWGWPPIAAPTCHMIVRLVCKHAHARRNFQAILVMMSWCRNYSYVLVSKAWTENMSNPNMNLCIDVSLCIDFMGIKMRVTGSLIREKEDVFWNIFLRLQNFLCGNRYALTVTVRKKNVFRVSCRGGNLAPEYIVLSLHVDFSFL